MTSDRFVVLKAAAVEGVASLGFHRSREGAECEECKTAGLLISCSSSSSVGRSVGEVMDHLAELDARGLLTEQQVAVIESLIDDDFSPEPEP
jgi:hypothetical protein